ncbi:SDR family NAD(P)-dependent oxidoreductase [Pseudomonas guariconensis]|uniref:SDR family NAD(P)-dependent oxidoreductase n=1 Tax=Pseudomonas guariconensis TaxID=1288410 RepID=UPI0038711349
MNRLTGKTALVTGGGQGVGHCPGVVRRGRAGGRRRTHTGPLDQAQAIEQCVAQVLEAFGTIDILVNNAQILPLDRLLEVSDEAFAQGMDSGPLATLRLMRACHPYLRGGGVVVNLASSAAVRWDACGYGAYAAAKEAIRCLSRAAACEWGPDGRPTPCLQSSKAGCKPTRKKPKRSCRAFRIAKTTSVERSRGWPATKQAI